MSLTKPEPTDDLDDMLCLAEVSLDRTRDLLVVVSRLLEDAGCSSLSQPAHVPDPNSWQYRMTLQTVDFLTSQAIREVGHELLRIRTYRAKSKSQG